MVCTISMASLGQRLSSFNPSLGNALTTFFLPSPRTAFNKMLFWLLEQFRWKDLEISDHNRSVMKTTITIDRAEAPATLLRRQMRSKSNRQPNTVGMLWTNSNNITAAMTLSIEHL